MKTHVTLTEEGARSLRATLISKAALAGLRFRLFPPSSEEDQIQFTNARAQAAKLRTQTVDDFINHAFDQRVATIEGALKLLGFNARRSATKRFILSLSHE